MSDTDVIQGRPPYKAEKREGDVEPQSFGQQQTAARPKVILRFAAEKDLLISGMLQNGGELAGKAAVIDCPVGKGHVVMFAINPMWRMQTHGSYQLLFNTAMNCRKL